VENHIQFTKNLYGPLFGYFFDNIPWRKEIHVMNEDRWFFLFLFEL